ncbi:unnamed protein product [Rhizophagus irregularis]|nr:unnamed protein product [Rhizophagus irregularis]
MNEFLSEEIPYNDIPHDEYLAIKVCKGHRPKISKDVPKLLADLVTRCWDAKIENRPITIELYQLLTKWNDEVNGDDSEDSEDVNSSDLSSFQFNSDTNSLENPISECLDVQLSELELNEIYQDGEIILNEVSFERMKSMI